MYCCKHGFFSTKATLLNKTDLVKKSYNISDFLLFVREGKGSVFISKFCCSSFCELLEVGLTFFVLRIALS